MQERLQKIISTAGIASRRKAEEFITQGRVSVNGHTVTVLGTKADPDRDHIRVNGKLIRIQEKRIYLLLNKPPGFVSTLRDPENRPTVIALLKGIRERVYPVGRLDYASSGLLLLTNDGELANLMMSRASEFPRTYQVKLEGAPAAGGLEKLKHGIPLDGRRTAPAQVKLLPSRTERAKPWYEITLTEGRYHQVRRMFERIGQGVLKLKRVRIAFLTDEGLPLGQFRHLTSHEVARLKGWKPAAGKHRVSMNDD